MYAVGDDGDWKRACRNAPLLLCVATLPKLLELFTDSILGVAIKKGLKDLNFELCELLDSRARFLSRRQRAGRRNIEIQHHDN